jgi:hypothetical protein
VCGGIIVVDGCVGSFLFLLVFVVEVVWMSMLVVVVVVYFDEVDDVVEELCVFGVDV